MEFLNIQKLLIFIISYFFYIDHLITELHKKFHNFITLLQFIMN